VSRRRQRAGGEGGRRQADGKRGPAGAQRGPAGAKRGPAGAQRGPAGGRREPAGAQSGSAPGRRPPRLSFLTQVGILVAVFAVVSLIAKLAGAANLGVALGIGQIFFAIALVALIVKT
jgi:hypothetical protein